MTVLRFNTVQIQRNYEILKCEIKTAKVKLNFNNLQRFYRLILNSTFTEKKGFC